MESRKYEGWWWFPGEERDRFPGILRFDPNEGATLEVIGNINEGGPFKKAQMFEYMNKEVVLGISSTEEITLYKVSQKQVHFATYLNLGQFDVGWVFIGAHFSKEAIGFKTALVGFTSLNEWKRTRAFNIQTDLIDRKTTIVYELPKSVGIASGSDYKINLAWKAKGPTISDVISDANITQEVYLEVEFGHVVYFGDLLKFLDKIRAFLCIAIGGPVYMLELSGIRSDSIQRVEVLHRLPRMQTGSENIRNWEMLFTCNGIESCIASVLPKFIENSELFDPVYDLVFTAIYYFDMPWKNKFLNYIQAFEAYHRRQMEKDLYWPPEEFSNLMSSIVSSVGEDKYKVWLKERLKYINQYSLRKRLKIVLEELQDEFSDFFLEWEKLADRIVKVRNLFVHFDPETKVEEPTDYELFVLVSKLELIMKICLLKEAGFGMDLLSKLLHSYNSHQGGIFKMNSFKEPQQ